MKTKEELKADKLELTYFHQGNHKFTFDGKKIKEFVENHCIGRTLNLFAGKNKLNIDEYRVDSNPEMIADWYGDAFEFVSTTNMAFGTVLLDPPYSLRKSMEKYKGHIVSNFQKIKLMIHGRIDPRRVINLGFESTCMGVARGYYKRALCVVCHGGAFHDTLILVEDKK